MRQPWPPQSKNGFGDHLPDFNPESFLLFMEGMITQGPGEIIFLKKAYHELKLPAKPYSYRRIGGKLILIRLQMSIFIAAGFSRRWHRRDAGAPD
jgi:hypothetical protein